MTVRKTIFGLRGASECQIKLTISKASDKPRVHAKAEGDRYAFIGLIIQIQGWFRAASRSLTPISSTITTQSRVDLSVSNRLYGIVHNDPQIKNFDLLLDIKCDDWGSDRFLWYVLLLLRLGFAVLPKLRRKFGLGELQHLDVLLSGYRGLGEPRSGNGVPNLQRREGLWLCYRIALRALPRQIRVCWSAKDLQVLLPTNRILEIPGRVVAVKLRHDAHLSASSHLFGLPGLWKARGQKGS
ncbi:hypothetical protein EVAR_72011_1 [Eumeta japonica]|uniref:Uncharacterized protein n=1 Tax=Eumeta variegata TaxID=151549 RepID=A0A4C1SMN8_EUMVA|nr:hypothetical protein EVAR_72011_1 [Eumeta japonica]